MYILWLWNTIQSFSISNMVSESLLWPFLSSLVFIGVTALSTSLLPSQQSPQPLTVEPITSSSHYLRVLDLQPLSLRSPTSHRLLHVSSRLEYCSNHISRGITKIVLNRSTRRWKPSSHRSQHMPSRAARSFCVIAPRAVLSSRWRHPWRHLCHVSPSYVSIQSSTDVIAASSWWRHLLTVDHWLWPAVDFSSGLTFAIQVLLTQFFA